MKKITKITVLLLALVIAMGTFSNTAFAASNTVIKKRSDSQTKALTQYAEYYGWDKEVTVKSQTVNKIVTNIILRNSKHNFNITQTTRRKSGTYKTTFAIKGENYSLNAIKASLKEYAIKDDYKQMVKDRAGTAADGLTAYAESMGWTVSFSESYKNGTATVKQTFSNSKYKFDTTVSAQRKSGKIAITYTRKGVKSSAKAIKGWLKTYKV